MSVSSVALAFGSVLLGPGFATTAGVVDFSETPDFGSASAAVDKTGGVADFFATGVLTTLD